MKVNKICFTQLNEENFKDLAIALSCFLKERFLVNKTAVVALNGELGSGKSTICRTIIRELARQDYIPSPTYNYVQTYDFNGGVIWHMDLYRLDDIFEVLELGIEEAQLSAICLIEWSGIAREVLDDDTIYIDISYSNCDTRDIELSSKIDLSGLDISATAHNNSKGIN